MVKGIIVLLLAGIFLVLGKLQAQNGSMISKGLIAGRATLTPSLHFGDDPNYFYLNGNLEGYLSPKLSIMGTGHYYLGRLGDTQGLFEYNHNLFLGPLWHFVQAETDLFVGIQPGLAFTKLSQIENNPADPSMGVNPLFSALGGYNFYMNDFLHFFLHSRLVLGKNTFGKPVDLAAFRFSLGLGFQLQALK